MFQHTRGRYDFKSVVFHKSQLIMIRIQVYMSNIKTVIFHVAISILKQFTFHAISASVLTQSKGICYKMSKYLTPYISIAV